MMDVKSSRRTLLCEFLSTGVVFGPIFYRRMWPTRAADWHLCGLSDGSRLSRSVFPSGILLPRLVLEFSSIHFDNMCVSHTSARLAVDCTMYHVGVQMNAARSDMFAHST